MDEVKVQDYLVLGFFRLLDCVFLMTTVHVV